MSEFVYNGEHSIRIKPRDASEWDDTWVKWRIAPTSRPMVNPPAPKTEYVDVPGSDGSLDFTELLAGVKYSNRSGSWQFIIENGNWDWPVLYTLFMEAYHGKAVDVILTDDPEYYYTGRISIANYTPGSDYSSFEIAYNFDPYKYPIESNINKYWLWDELFGTPSLYGPILVQGKVWRNLYNPFDSAQSVNVNTTARVFYEIWEYEPHTYLDGKEGYVRTRIQFGYIDPGDTSDLFSIPAKFSKLIYLQGDALVKIDYGTGKRL